MTRPHFAAGTIGLVPAHFSEVYQLMRMRADDPLVLAAASPPDRHGYFSLGVSADYTASFIGRARFFLEVTDAMPRTFGRNQIHVSQVVGWCRSDRPLVERAAEAARRRRSSDRRIRRRADPERRDDPDRHRRHPQRDHGTRCATIAISACTPSCCPTAWST